MTAAGPDQSYGPSGAAGNGDGPAPAPGPDLAAAPLWRRAAAGTVDGALGWLVSEGLIRALGGERPSPPRPPRRRRLPGRRRSPGEELRRSFFGAPTRHTAVMGVAPVLAAAPAMVRDGRTPGQRAAGIRLVRTDGAEAGLARGLARQFAPQGALVAAQLARSLTALGLGLALAAADAAAWLVGDERRTLRDRALGTRVVRA